MKRTLFLIAGMFVCLCAEAQLIRGRVLDAKTGDPLPTATVQADSTYRATITSRDGSYELWADSLPVTLIVRYIGYETARRQVAPGDSTRQDFRLLPVVYVMDEVTITGEEPAIGIMRKVIERKQKMRATLASYEVAADNRFTVSNDTGIVVIMETATTAYWDREKGMKEVVKARRKTANFDLEEQLPAAFFVTNLYDDDVTVGGHRLVGVTHPKALDVYRFSLEGVRRLDDTDIYDIRVEPKNKFVSGFSGRVSVMDEAYAMIDVELAPGGTFLFPQPIRGFDVTYRQQFSSFGGEVWLPVDFRAETTLDVGLSGILELPEIHIDQVSRLTDYAVNVAVPESLFVEDTVLHVDSAEVETGRMLEQEGLVVPLMSEEKTAYAQLDSTMEWQEAFAPTGILSRFVRSGGSWRITSERWKFLKFLDLRPELWYNRVDAFHGGLGATLEAGNHIVLGGRGAWSSGLTGSDAWSYHAMARLSSGGDKDLFLEGRYLSEIDVQYASVSHARFTNSISVLLGGSDYFDYYRREGFHLTAGVVMDKIDAVFSGKVRLEDHVSLQRTTSYDIVGNKEPLRDNPPVTDGKLRAVIGSVVLGNKERSLGGLLGRRRLELNVEYGMLNETYMRYSLKADWRQPTFFRRRLLPNTLDVRLIVGRSTGMLPPQRTFIIDTAGGSGFALFGDIRTPPFDIPYRGHDVLAVFWEHNFRTLFFEIVGLGAMVRRNYNIILFGTHARVWVDDTRPPVNQWNSPDVFHHELGVSLSGIFGFLRLDVTRSLGSNGGFRLGYGIARIF